MLIFNRCNAEKLYLWNSAFPSFPKRFSPGWHTKPSLYGERGKLGSAVETLLNEVAVSCVVEKQKSTAKSLFKNQL